MNRYGNHNMGDAVRQFFGQKSILPRLILLNVLVFTLVHLINLFQWLFGIAPQTNEGLSFIGSLLSVPASFQQLAHQPWTLFTYMFLHEDFFHLLFNMMVLYSGGSIFLMYLSQRQLLLTYLFGGLMGAIFFIAAFNFFPVFDGINDRAIALGASAAVLSILIAISVYVPQFTVNLMFIGQIRLKYLALIFLVLDLFSIQGSNPGGHIAHLGGAFWGILFSLSLRQKIDLYSVFDFFRHKKLRVAYKKNTANDVRRPLSDEEFNRKRNEISQRIDLILDKISKSGYSSLSEEEKEFLFRMSNKNKG